LDSKAAGTSWMQKSGVLFDAELRGLMRGMCRVYVGLQERTQTKQEIKEEGSTITSEDRDMGWLNCSRRMQTY